MKQKINLRLTLIALVAVFSATIGVTFLYYNLFQSQVKKDLALYTRLLSDTGVFQSAYAGTEDVNAYVENAALRQLMHDNPRITWVSADGTVLYDNGADVSGLPNHLDRPEIREAIRNGSGESVRRSDTFQLNTFYYALLLEDRTILRTSTEASSISSVFVQSLPVIFFISAAFLVICILLGHFLTIQLLKPLDEMAERLDSPIEKPVYRELKPFADKIRSQHENILEAASIRQDFTANVSHELKTPLTAISGYAELLENDMVPHGQVGHIAEQIRHNSDRLLSLINDIIRLSELDHKELPRKFTTMDLRTLAEECCGNLSVSARARHLTLTCKGDSAILSGDRDLLKELMENLIQNAIQYNRENGSILVRTGQKDHHPFLSVQDTGIGIPKNQQERIFERFYRIDKSRSRETGGTGLGLAIVKHIAEIHDADIIVESEPGKGTCITVSF
jgi:two-component system phosphate regulon sensor histidine kinase PhoR